MSSETYTEHGESLFLSCACGRVYTRDDMRYLALSEEYRHKCACGAINYAEPL